MSTAANAAFSYHSFSNCLLVNGRLQKSRRKKLEEFEKKTPTTDSGYLQIQEQVRQLEEECQRAEVKGTLSG